MTVWCWKIACVKQALLIVFRYRIWNKIIQPFKILIKLKHAAFSGEPINANKISVTPPPTWPHYHVIMWQHHNKNVCLLFGAVNCLIVSQIYQCVHLRQTTSKLASNEDFFINKPSQTQTTQSVNEYFHVSDLLVSLSSLLILFISDATILCFVKSVIMEPTASGIFCNRMLSMVNSEDVNAIIQAQRHMWVSLPSEWPN